MYRRTLIASALAAFATSFTTSANAMPQPYGLGPGGATITYTFTLNGAPVTGTVPINRADLTINTSDLAASTALVTADVRRARTGLIFATEALKSESVLAARMHPLARFQSTKVILGENDRLSGGAIVEGLLTLRGITRPVRFDAQLFRKAGTAGDDLNMLNVMLTGTINRRDFGAVGYADLVDDVVKIDIEAQIETSA